MHGYSKVILINWQTSPIVLLSGHMEHSQVDFWYRRSYLYMWYMWHRLYSIMQNFKIALSYYHWTQSRFILYVDNGFACNRCYNYGYNGDALTCRLWRENGASDHTATYFGGVHPASTRRSPLLATLSKYAQNFSLLRCSHGNNVIYNNCFGVVTLSSQYEWSRIA